MEWPLRHADFRILKNGSLGSGDSTMRPTQTGACFDDMIPGMKQNAAAVRIARALFAAS